MTRIKDAAWADDDAGQASGVAALRTIYGRESHAGRSDPFLTETLADFIDDPQEAAALYGLSLEQSLEHPGEPLHTKRIGLARALIELEEPARAMAALDAARFEANRNRDREALKEIAELIESMRRNDSDERTR